MYNTSSQCKTHRRGIQQLYHPTNLGFTLAKPQSCCGHWWGDAKWQLCPHADRWDLTNHHPSKQRVMTEAHFNPYAAVLPGWSPRSRRDLGILLTPSHRWGAGSVWAGLQLSRTFFLLVAARNLLDACLNPGVKPLGFCLKLQCPQVSTLPYFFTLMRSHTSWPLWRLLIAYMFLWYSLSWDGQSNTTGMVSYVITLCTRLFLSGSYRWLYHVLILENLKHLKVL